MHARPQPRRAIAVLASAAALTAATAALAGVRPATLHLGGTWSGTYTGAVSGTFTLHWTQTGSRLTGTISLSRPHGKYGISGSVRRSTIRFGAVGVGATYAGTVSGSSMSGTWKSPQGGGRWSAHKLATR